MSVTVYLAVIYMIYSIRVRETNNRLLLILLLTETYNTGLTKEKSLQSVLSWRLSITSDTFTI